MKKIFTLIGLFMSLSSFGQMAIYNSLYIRTQIQIGDSIVTDWYSGTLANTDYVDEQATASVDTIYAEAQGEWVGNNDTIQKDTIYALGQNEWVGMGDTIRKIDTANYATTSGDAVTVGASNYVPFSGTGDFNYNGNFQYSTGLYLGSSGSSNAQQNTNSGTGKGLYILNNSSGLAQHIRDNGGTGDLLLIDTSTDTTLLVKEDTVVMGKEVKSAKWITGDNENVVKVVNKQTGLEDTLSITTVDFDTVGNNKTATVYLTDTQIQTGDSVLLIPAESGKTHFITGCAFYADNYIAGPVNPANDSINTYDETGTKQALVVFDALFSSVTYDEQIIYEDPGFNYHTLDVDFDNNGINKPIWFIITAHTGDATINGYFKIFYRTETW